MEPPDTSALPNDPDAGAGPSPAGGDRARPGLDVVAAVATGGALGSLGRYGIGRIWPVAEGRFPTSVLVVNLTGSFLLGLVLVVLVERRAPSRYARAFLAVGILGGFTTFSTFAVDAVQLGLDHHVGVAAAFVVSSAIGGIVAAGTGVAAGRVGRGR